MNKYAIFTDVNSDLPDSYTTKHNIPCVPLDYLVNDKTYGLEEKLEITEFYNLMKEGATPTTNQVSPTRARMFMEKALKEEKDILFIAFTSELSGTYNSVLMASNELIEEYPDRKIIIVDSLGASLGEGLLVYNAVNNRTAGMSIEDNAKILEDLKSKICQFFTVEDLVYLQRGGRISKTSAVIGGMLNVKPILHVSNEGRLAPINKVRGRKKSLLTLIDYMEEKLADKKLDDDYIVFISHADCLEDAEFVKSHVQKKFGINNFMISYISPALGSHAGPGAVALFFIADDRL